MKRGQQKTYPAHSGHHDPLHLIGAFDATTTRVHSLTVAHKNSTTFIQFLEYLCLTLFPNDPLVLVLDNVSYHRSDPVMALFSLLQPRVQVLWLPKYSPDMNPIERFWLHLKDHAYANCLLTSPLHLKQQIQLWLDIQHCLTHPDRLSFANSFR